MILTAKLRYIIMLLCDNSLFMKLDNFIAEKAFLFTTLYACHIMCIFQIMNIWLSNFDNISGDTLGRHALV